MTELSTPKGAEAEWFNSSWAYRKAINITAHTAAENTVYINLASSNALDTSDSTKYQSDCGDLRLTDNSGKLLPYYIVSGCGTATTVVHVFLQSFPAGDQTLYYYYGNPSAVNGFSSSDFSPEASNYTIGSIGSEQSGPSPVAYWKFDEGTGTTANNSVSGGLSGTLSGTTLPAWTSDQCVSLKCLYFNGITSNVSVSGTISGVKTITFWVNPSASSTAELIALNSTTRVRSTSGTVTAPGSTSPTVYVNGVANGTVTANRWNYVTVTTGTAISASAITIGKGPLGVLKGYVDEVKLYNTALSSTQVTANYNARGSLQGANVLGAKDQSYLTNGLVGYWKMDETSANTCSGGSNDNCDSSGNGYDLAWNGGATASDSGKFGSAVDINSSTGTATYGTGNYSYTNGATQLTMSAWAKFPTGATEHYILHVNGPFDLRIGTNTAAALVNAGGGSTVIRITTSTISANQWYLLTATWDGKIINIYLNGSLIGSGVYTGNGVLANGGSQLTVGTDSSLAGSYTGQIDEVRVYKRALSPLEVESLYNYAPSPLIYYNFEEAGGSTVIDRSGNGLGGTWAGTGRRYTSGKYGKAGDFNGSDDTVTVADSTSWDNFANGSVDFWVRPTFFNGSAGVQHGVSTKNAALSNNGDMSCGFVGSTGAFRCDADSGVSQVQINWPSSSPLNTWSHIALTWNNDGTNVTFTPYLNGVAGTTKQLSHDTRPFSSTVAFQLAATSFKGQLDDYRFYNYTRSAKQITEDMNGSHPAGGSPVGSQIGWWKFDAGTGNVASNSGTLRDTLNGGMYNFSSPASAISGWSNDGRFNKALNFDGSNDAVEAGSDSSIDDMSSFTFSLWFNPRTSGEASAGTIIDKAASGTPTNGWLMWMDSTRHLRFSVDYSGTNLLVITTTTIPYGNWSHIATTWDGSSSASSVHIYINGKEATYSTQTDGTSSRVTDAAATLKFGASSGGTFDTDGWIDEVKLYNFVLSPSEVKVDYNRNQSVRWGGLGIDPSDGVSASGSANASYCVPGDTTTLSCQPSGEWKFDEGQGNKVSDNTGNESTGTWSGTGQHWINGKYGKAGFFNGSDDYVATSGQFNFLHANSFSVAAWVKSSFVSSSGTNTYSIVSKGCGFVGTYSLWYRASTTNADARFCIHPTTGGGSQTTAISTTKINDNKWHYLVGVRDATAGNIYIYVDGRLEGTTADATSGDFNRASTVNIGSRGVDNSELFTGSIDQPQIYSYALSPAQVAWNYNKGKPIAQYRFDECQGTTVNDVTGNGKRGIINIGAGGSQSSVGTCSTSSTAWGNGASGKYNYSLNLDGTDDYVNVANPNLPTGDYTYAAWVYPTRVSDTIFMAANGSGQNEFSAVITGASKIQVFNHAATALTTTNTVSLNTWTHLVVTRSGSSIKVYINGNQDPTTGSDSSTLSFSTCDLLLGVDADSSCTGTLGGYLQGKIDDSQIFNFALTPIQIRNLMNQGAVRFGPLTGAP